MYNLIGTILIVLIIVFATLHIKDVARSENLIEGIKSSLTANNVDYKCNPNAIVSRVIDGDTLVLTNGDKIRFANVDAYERSSIIHQTIMNDIRPMLVNKSICVDYRGIDKYGRKIGNINLTNGMNINAYLVQKGYAVVYDQYCDKKSEEYKILKQLEQEAKLKRLGGWGLNLPLPSVDRKNKKNN